jgi:hypothetical protein
MASHPNTLRNMQEKMGKTFDQQVVAWKGEI